MAFLLIKIQRLPRLISSNSFTPPYELAALTGHAFTPNLLYYSMLIEQGIYLNKPSLKDFTFTFCKSIIAKINIRESLQEVVNLLGPLSLRIRTHLSPGPIYHSRLRVLNMRRDHFHNFIRRSSAFYFN